MEKWMEDSLDADIHVFKKDKPEETAMEGVNPAFQNRFFTAIRSAKNRSLLVVRRLSLAVANVVSPRAKDSATDNIPPSQSSKIVPVVEISPRIPSSSFQQSSDFQVSGNKGNESGRYIESSKKNHEILTSLKINATTKSRANSKSRRRSSSNIILPPIANRRASGKVHPFFISDNY